MDNERELRLIAEGIRTGLEFYVGTHGPEEAPSEAMREKLFQAIGGADLPEDEHQHAARDVQFELYVHGLFAAGCAKPWFEEPPDLRFVYGNEVIGVAVKRLWSQKGAHGQLSDGANQVERCQLRGLIASNTQEYVQGIPLDEAVHVRGQAFNEQLVRLHGQFPYLARKSHMLGLLVCGTAAEWRARGDGPRQLGVAMYHQLLLLGESNAEEAFATYYFDGFGVNLRAWYEQNL